MKELDLLLSDPCIPASPSVRRPPCGPVPGFGAGDTCCDRGTWPRESGTDRPNSERVPAGEGQGARPGEPESSRGEGPWSPANPSIHRTRRLLWCPLLPPLSLRHRTVIIWSLKQIFQGANWKPLAPPPQGHPCSLPQARVVCVSGGPSERSSFDGQSACHSSLYSKPRAQRSGRTPPKSPWPVTIPPPFEHPQYGPCASVHGVASLGKEW